MEKLQQTLDKLMVLQQRLLDQELCGWQREQQMAGNGRPFNEAKLNQIQEWYVVHWTVFNIFLLFEQHSQYN